MDRDATVGAGVGIELVERRSIPDDRRGNLVSLTRAGETAFRPAGRIHIEGIDRHVGAHLDTHEMAELRRLLTKLVNSDPADS